jgi:hypothetical protein
MDDDPSSRIRRLRATLAATRRVHPKNHASADEIARFHELHARHEREEGREWRAAVAEGRARRARGH